MANDINDQESKIKVLELQQLSEVEGGVAEGDSWSATSVRCDVDADWSTMSENCK